MFEARKARKERDRYARMPPERQMTDDFIKLGGELVGAEMCLTRMMQKVDESEEAHAWLKEHYERILEIRLEVNALADSRIKSAIASALGYDV